MFEEIYQLIASRARVDASVSKVVIGLNWTVAVVVDKSGNTAAGLCYSPVNAGRTLPWSGTLVGKPVSEVVPWQLSWNPVEAVVGTAVANATVNLQSSLSQDAIELDNPAPGHLKVFEYFFSTQVMAGEPGSPVAVIGHYPGIERFAGSVPMTILEKNPQPGDLPDTAAESVLPRASWVFITASSLANKSLPRLLELSRNARVVLMGPSLPWLREWRDFGVDYLCGVTVNNLSHLLDVASEAGGTRIFDTAVSYKLLKF